VFDPATIADRSTFSAPNELAVGMRWVLVNGVPVIADGKMTGAKPGQVLRGPGYTAADAHRRLVQMSRPGLSTRR
jgi:N-acyl-D-amino-acid deacylase